MQTANISSGFILRGIHTGNRTCSKPGANQVRRIFKSLARTAELKDEIAIGIGGLHARWGGAGPIFERRKFASDNGQGWLV